MSGAFGLATKNAASIAPESSRFAAARPPIFMMVVGGFAMPVASSSTMARAAEPLLSAPMAIIFPPRGGSLSSV